MNLRLEGKEEEDTTATDEGPASSSDDDDVAMQDEVELLKSSEKEIDRSTFEDVALSTSLESTVISLEADAPSLEQLLSPSIADVSTSTTRRNARASPMISVKKDRVSPDQSPSLSPRLQKSTAPRLGDSLLYDDARSRFSQYLSTERSSDRSQRPSKSPTLNQRLSKSPQRRKSSAVDERQRVPPSTYLPSSV